MLHSFCNPQPDLDFKTNIGYICIPPLSFVIYRYVFQEPLSIFPLLPVVVSLWNGKKFDAMVADSR